MSNNKIDFGGMFPSLVRDTAIEKALKFFEPDNTGEPAIVCFVLKPEQETDDKGNLRFFEKGRNKGKPVMTISALPFCNDVVQLNNDLFNDLKKSHTEVLTLRDTVKNKDKDIADLKTYVAHLKSQLS